MGHPNACDSRTDHGVRQTERSCRKLAGEAKPEQRNYREQLLHVDNVSLSIRKYELRGDLGAGRKELMGAGPIIEPALYN
jgi:hypothetical protein